MPILDIYNTAKPLICGKYISFLDNTMHYSEDTLQFVYEELSQGKLNAYSVCPVFIDPNENESRYPIIPVESGCFNSVSDPRNTQFFLGAYFIKSEIVNELGFEASVITEKDKDFLIRFLIKYNLIHYSDEYMLYYKNAAENGFSTNFIQYKKEWYQDDVEGFLYSLAQKADEFLEEEKMFILSAVYYLLYARFNCNTNDRNKKVLNADEIDRFYSSAGKVFAFIPDYIMMQKMMIGKFHVIRNLKFFLLKLKYDSLGKKYRIVDNEKRFFLFSGYDEKIGNDCVIYANDGKYTVTPQNQITFEFNDASYENDEDQIVINPFAASLLPPDKLIDIGPIAAEKVIIAAVNYENRNIEIDAKSVLVDYFDNEDINISITVNNEEIETKPVECYPFLRSFGRVFLKKYQFHFSVPVDLAPYIKVAFFLVRNGKKYSQKLTFSEAASKLSNKMVGSYWNFDKGKLMFYKVPNKLIIRNANHLQLIYREYKYLLRFCMHLHKRKLWHDCKNLFKLRIAYQTKKHLYKNKRIWVMFDKLYKAGDNGEYMYHYLKNNDLGITPYYIVNEDSPDYKRLKDAGENVLISNSDECKLMCLLAEAVLATHATIWQYCGFSKAEQQYFKDLFNAKLICIQHGLTVQQIAQYQNRLFDNTQFYCCASKYEVENILQPIYGYEPEKIKLTGLARYDGLRNNDKKIILITPTWRRDIVNNGIAYIKKTHNNHFKESTYYKIYNKLINDKTLIDKARETGYEIMFLLHPAMSSQSVDYDRNDYVKIVEAASDISYEKILTESSLMVTDYSGVQFDFAYMRKPLVYYHPSALPPFYEESIYKYDTMAFGEICTEHNELVNILCEYMDNDCKCKEKYIKRADDFFAFDDYNSCERIYKAVCEFLENSL